MEIILVNGKTYAVENDCICIPSKMQKSLRNQIKRELKKFLAAKYEA